MVTTISFDCDDHVFAHVGVYSH